MNCPTRRSKCLPTTSPALKQRSHSFMMSSRQLQNHITVISLTVRNDRSGSHTQFQCSSSQESRRSAHQWIAQQFRGRESSTVPLYYRNHAGLQLLYRTLPRTVQDAHLLYGKRIIDWIDNWLFSARHKCGWHLTSLRCSWQSRSEYQYRNSSVGLSNDNYQGVAPEFSSALVFETRRNANGTYVKVANTVNKRLLIIHAQIFLKNGHKANFVDTNNCATDCSLAAVTAVGIRNIPIYISDVAREDTSLSGGLPSCDHRPDSVFVMLIVVFAPS